MVAADAQVPSITWVMPCLSPCPPGSHPTSLFPRVVLHSSLCHRLMTNYVTFVAGEILLLILTVCSLAAIFPRVRRMFLNRGPGGVTLPIASCHPPVHPPTHPSTSGHTGRGPSGQREWAQPGPGLLQAGAGGQPASMRMAGNEQCFRKNDPRGGFLGNRGSDSERQGKWPGRQTAPKILPCIAWGLAPRTVSVRSPGGLTGTPDSCTLSSGWPLVTFPGHPPCSKPA